MRIKTVTALVALCFAQGGAAMDFITHDQRRAPAFLRRWGLEWFWRLALSPRRLARRYLIEGPRAWWILRTDSSTLRNPTVPSH